MPNVSTDNCQAPLVTRKARLQNAPGATSIYNQKIMMVLDVNIVALYELLPIIDLLSAQQAAGLLTSAAQEEES